MSHPFLLLREMAGPDQPLQVGYKQTSIVMLAYLKRTGEERSLPIATACVFIVTITINIYI